MGYRPVVLGLKGLHTVVLGVWGLHTVVLGLWGVTYCCARGLGVTDLLYYVLGSYRLLC